MPADNKEHPRTDDVSTDQIPYKPSLETIDSSLLHMNCFFCNSFTMKVSLSDGYDIWTIDRFLYIGL